MTTNPFTNMFRYRTARDPFQLMQCIGHKCIEDSDNATFGMEYPRQILIDYYGPNHRNAEFDLDTAKFYYYQYKETSGVCHNIWLCVTLSEDTILNLSGIFPDINTHLYVVSKCSVDISDNTIKACRLLFRFYTMMLQNFFNPSNRLYPYNSGNTVIHILANYMYRAFDIDLSKEDNFNIAVLYTNSTPSYAKNMYEFFKKDFVYCHTIAREDLNYPKVIGTGYRFNKEYGFNSDVIHGNNGETFNKNDEVDPEHKVFNTDFSLTFDDVSKLTDIVVNSAGWSLSCIDYDNNDLDEIRVILHNIFFYPRTGNFAVEDVFTVSLIATTGFAIASRPTGSDHNELYSEDNIKKVIDYLKCLNSVNDGSIDVIKVFFVKLRAMLCLEDIDAIYYCTAIDSLLNSIRTQTRYNTTITLTPYDNMTIRNLHNFNQLIGKSLDDVDVYDLGRTFGETDQIELAEFLFNIYTPVCDDKTPWGIAVDYCDDVIEGLIKSNGDKDDNFNKEDTENSL